VKLENNQAENNVKRELRLLWQTWRATCFLLTVTSELVPVWFQSSSLGAVDAIDSRCAAAVHFREARRRHHLSRQAPENEALQNN
jgi:hypothetical protein